ncbi:uncharacterized protein LOC130948128 [Arachis stenosperma]|uniref:uncharacterized protein LOC130948128 n=1 Tax=Arachis stenosperma TaxID=217475 RepID=UPI0025ABA660|nr:uncharacterized protein LOC130948128 [Arachis stenosperma]
MVLNSLIAVSVAHVSAEAWQRASCISDNDRVSSSQLLDLVCCFPLHQFGRFALFLWTFLCFSPPPLDYYYYYDEDEDD